MPLLGFFCGVVAEACRAALDSSERMFYPLVMSHGLEHAVGRFRRQPQPEGEGRVSAAAFRAAVQERLRHLERELAELKGRINGLIFLVAGTVIAQVVLKLAG